MYHEKKSQKTILLWWVHSEDFLLSLSLFFFGAYRDRKVESQDPQAQREAVVANVRRVSLPRGDQVRSKLQEKGLQL